MSDALPLDLLACPACRNSLRAEGGALVCAGCAARYGVVEHGAELIPADVRARMAGEGAPDGGWQRWREAIRGLEAWRARRGHRVALGGGSDGTSDADARALFERAGVAGVVVDVGAKDGSKYRLLPPGTRYVGVDPFAERVPGLPPEAVVVRGVAEALPVRDGAADAVISLAAFDYFADGHAAVAEMARVLRPGGALAVLVSVVSSTVAHARGAPSRFSRVGSSLRAARELGALAGAGLVGAALLERDRPHTHYYTRAQCTAMIGVRFQIESVREVEQPTSTILYIAARKKRATRLNVLR